MWFVARFPLGRAVGGCICLLFGVVYLFFFFFLVGCSGVIDVFSVFGVALSVQGGSCVLCFLLQGGLGPASVVYCFVRLRWSHQTLKLS